MIKQRQGFTLIELIVTMAILGISLTLMGRFFADQLMTFKQQAKLSESNIEGVAGLELMRRDVEHAGYGLPWEIPTDVEYSEAAAAPANAYNDCSGSGPCPAPIAVLSGDGSGSGGSDYLVIKAVNVGLSDAANKWTLLQSDSYSTYNLKSWTSTKDENLTANEKVTILTIGGEDRMRTLVKLNDTFYDTYGNVATGVASLLPTVGQIRVVYGIATADTASLRMPFNRADYYVSLSGVPSACAPNTGVLTKATINQVGGGRTSTPLLDCVADMQVVYGVDSDPTPNGLKDCYADDPADGMATVDAENIRTRVKEVRVYILAHEGQSDRTFSFNAPVDVSSIRVGALSSELPSGTSICTGAGLVGREFDLSSIGSNWRNYRWKVYSMVVTPHNLQ